MLDARQCHDIHCKSVCGLSYPTKYFINKFSTCHNYLFWLGPRIVCDLFSGGPVLILEICIYVFIYSSEAIYLELVLEVGQQVV